MEKRKLKKLRKFAKKAGLSKEEYKEIKNGKFKTKTNFRLNPLTVAIKKAMMNWNTCTQT